MPAILAISSGPFIGYASNIFAIPGLRALYFAWAAMEHRFKYLKYTLAGVLVFIGGKNFAAGLVGKTPPSFSLGVPFGLIADGVLWSMGQTRGLASSSPARP